MAESIGEESPTGSAESFPELGIGGELQDRRGQTIEVGFLSAPISLPLRP